MNKQFWKILTPVLGLGIGISLGLMIAFLAGESPITILQVLFKSSFGSKYDFGLTLYYTTPLIFSGLAVSLAFHSGLFNVGVEGQLNIAAFSLAIFPIIFNFPEFLGPFPGILFAAAMAAIWAWIPAWLRTRRGSHEVINTIMLNFVASGIISWLLSSHFQNPKSQNPETAELTQTYFVRTTDPIAKYFGDAPIGLALPIAIICSVFLYLFLKKSLLGYRIIACGKNERAAAVAGINVAKTRQWAMALSGALAVGTAICEVMGNSGKFKMGFSPDFGFMGIAVALLVNNNPLAILFSALLFGALHKGSADLDIETEHMTRDLSVVFQALIILSVTCMSFLPSWLESRKKR